MRYTARVTETEAGAPTLGSDAPLRCNVGELDEWRTSLCDPARLEAVRRLGLLDSQPEPAFDRLTRIARKMLGGSIALLSVIDDQRQFNKSVSGAEGLREVPVDGSFCKYVVAKQSPIVVADAQQHDVLRRLLGENPLGIKSYVGVPILIDSQHVVGVLCVLGDRPRQFSPEDLELLADLAQIAADEISMRRATAEIEAQRRLLVAVVESVQEPILVVERSGQVLLRNSAYDALFSSPGARLDLANVERLGCFHADGVTPLDYATSPLGRVLAGESPVRMDILFRSPPPGEDRNLRASAVALHAHDGSVGAGILVLHDVSEERRRNRAHEEREVLLDAVLGILPDTGVFVFDRKLDFLVAGGNTVLRQLGLSGDAVGKHVSQVASPKHAATLSAAFERTLEGTRVQRRIDRDGRALDAQTIPLRNKSGEVFAGLALVNDITERVETERLLMDQARELQALSLTDELTGLNNRRGFVTIAAQQLKVAARSLRHAAVIYLDVNDLKPVNDSLGHEEGDRLLRDVAQVLTVCFRDSDVMARLGGDEFAVLTIDVSPQSSTLLEERVARAERAFNQRGERDYRMSLSLGIELFDPRDPVSLDVLLARADERMYARKQARKQKPEGEI